MNRKYVFLLFVAVGALGWQIDLKPSYYEDLSGYGTDDEFSYHRVPEERKMTLYGLLYGSTEKELNRLKGQGQNIIESRDPDIRNIMKRQKKLKKDYQKFLSNLPSDVSPTGKAAMKSLFVNLNEDINDKLLRMQGKPPKKQLYMKPLDFERRRRQRQGLLFKE